MNNITIGSNGTFTLTLGVTTNFISSGYTVFYQSDNAFNFIQLTGRTNLNAIMNDPTTSDAVAFGPPGNGRLMFGPSGHSNQFDLGYTGDQVNNQAAGTFTLQSINVSLLNLAPGTYTIFLDSRSIMTEHNTPGSFNDVNMGNGTMGSPIFTINVVPEPATIGLALVGGALLLLVIYRKQRARA
ncbi:MAG: PEP-CTERM sorting domain-containing protein [Chthoniobacterales bacterium]